MTRLALLLRAVLCERAFAHVLNRGGMRRSGWGVTVMTALAGGAIDGVPVDPALGVASTTSRR